MNKKIKIIFAVVLATTSLSILYQNTKANSSLTDGNFKSKVYLSKIVSNENPENNEVFVLNNKEIKSLGKDIYPNMIEYYDSLKGYLAISPDSNELNLIYNNGNTRFIADNIIDFKVIQNTIYYLNSKSELYKYNLKNKETDFIDQKVLNINSQDDIFYYLTEDNKLKFMIYGREFLSVDTKLSASFEDNIKINRQENKIIYPKEDGIYLYYINRKKNNEVKLSDNPRLYTAEFLKDASIVFSTYSDNNPENIDIYRKVGDTEPKLLKTIPFDFKTLYSISDNSKGIVFEDKNLYYLNFKDEKITEMHTEGEIVDYHLYKDKIAFVSNGELLRLSLNDPSDKEIIAKDITPFNTEVINNELVYLNTNKELHYKNELIAKDVLEFITHKDYIIYKTTSNNIYMTSSNLKTSKLLEINGQSLNSVNVDDKAISISQNDK